MITKINKDGRILIPKIIRKTLGIESGEEIQIDYKDKKIIITKLQKTK